MVVHQTRSQTIIIIILYQDGVRYVEKVMTEMRSIYSFGVKNLIYPLNNQIKRIKFVIKMKFHLIL